MDAKIYNNEKLITTLEEVIKNHGLEIETCLTPRIQNRITGKITNDIVKIKTYYIIGEPDTFKVAACIMIAINKGLDIKDNLEKAQIALDVAYRFIEKPYWNEGPNHDQAVALEEVDLQEAYKDNQDEFNTSNEYLLNSLMYVEGDPINYFLNLELIYDIAIALKHQQNPSEELNIEKPTEEKVLKKTKKRSLLDIFRTKKED